MPDTYVRATRLYAEVLTKVPPPATRATRLYAEALTLPAPPPAQATRLYAEALTLPAPPPAQATRLYAEALTLPAPPSARATTLYAEVLSKVPPPRLRVRLLQLEVLARRNPTDPSEFTNLMYDTARYWPVTLPGPQVDTLSVSNQDGVLRSSIDSGLTKARQRSTLSAQYVKLEWLLDDAQLDEFEAFFDNDIAYGALSFLWPHPLKTKTLAPLFDSGTEVPNVNKYIFLSVRFKSPYEKQRVNMDRFIEDIRADYSVWVASAWKVSAELEVIPGPNMFY